MPKRKVKEEKPRKRLGKKELLIPPAAMGISLLITLVIIPRIAPPPLPLEVCLKGHNVDTNRIIHKHLANINKGKKEMEIVLLWIDLNFYVVHLCVLFYCREHHCLHRLP
jgi:hypothetical protein